MMMMQQNLAQKMPVGDETGQRKQPLFMSRYYSQTLLHYKEKAIL